MTAHFISYFLLYFCYIFPNNDTIFLQFNSKHAQLLCQLFWISYIVSRGASSLCLRLDCMTFVASSFRFHSQKYVCNPSLIYTALVQYMLHLICTNNLVDIADIFYLKRIYLFLYRLHIL